MMANSRLQKIETLLTPKQAVLLWLTESQKLGLAAALEKVHRDPNTAPRVRIPMILEEHLRNSLENANSKADLVERAVRDMRREVDFLIVLAVSLRKAVALECDCNLAKNMLILERYHHLLERYVHRRKWDRDSWDIWRQCLTQRLFEFWCLRESLAVIRARYFNGHCVLFPAQEDELRLQIELLETLAKQYNHLKRNRIRLAGLRASLKEEVVKEAARLVAFARSASLADLGQHEASSRIIEPYILAEIDRLRVKGDKKSIRQAAMLAGTQGGY